MFDLQKNLLTTLLGGALILLGAVGVAQTVFMGRANVDSIAPLGAESVGQAVVDRPDTSLLEVDDYRVITDKPLFFANRRLPAVQVEGEEGEEEIEEEPMLAEIGELQVAVTGIIIDPEVKIALVTDKVSNETQVMSEGMALEGEQADWSLDSLSERNAKFVAADGRETEMELEVYTDSLAASSIQTSASDGRTDDRRRGRRADRSEADEEARARAEEVRRRVAERRAQLRAEAEKRRRQRQQ